MPKPQATAAIDNLTNACFLHSPKSLSTSSGSGPSESGFEASLVILSISLLTGITVGRIL